MRVDENQVKRKDRELKNGHKTAFEDHFAAIYGERWPGLRAALLRDLRQEVLQNPFGLQDYRLDAASLLPPRQLQVLAGECVADFCASPGGKSLAMIFALRGEAHWFLNDMSPGRVQRLKAVLHDCVPEAIFRSRLHISRQDASRWGLDRPEHFDKVLVDAPCSGERHLLSSTAELARWSLKGAKRLVMRQHALLCAGLDSLKPGGRLVYSTCSINVMENDGVIERLSKSREGQFRVVPVVEEIGEATSCGWIVLPDRFDCGPIYFSVLEKLASSKG